MEGKGRLFLLQRQRVNVVRAGVAQNEGIIRRVHAQRTVVEPGQVPVAEVHHHLCSSALHRDSKDARLWPVRQEEDPPAIGGEVREAQVAFQRQQSPPLRSQIVKRDSFGPVIQSRDCSFTIRSRLARSTGDDERYTDAFGFAMDSSLNLQVASTFPYKMSQREVTRASAVSASK